MTDGQKLFNHMAAARMGNSGKLPQEKWIEEADAFMDKHRPKTKKKVNVLGKGRTDEEWLKDLQSNPDLDGVDIEDQARRCRVHFSGRGIVPSRARMITWLSRADRTLPMGQRKETVYNDVYKEPISDLWRRAAKRKFPSTIISESNWFDLSTGTRADILKEMNR